MHNLLPTGTHSLRWNSPVYLCFLEMAQWWKAAKIHCIALSNVHKNISKHHWEKCPRREAIHPVDRVTNVFDVGVCGW